MSGTLEMTSERCESKIIETHKEAMVGGSNPSTVKLNKAGIRRFENLGLPDSRHEMFSYVNTRLLFEADLKPASPCEIDLKKVKKWVYADCERSHVTLVDGEYRPDLSDFSSCGDGMSVGCDQDVPDFLLNTVEGEDDVFSVLNAAFCRQILTVNVTDNKVVETPLQILFISTGKTREQENSWPHALVRVGSLGELKLIVRYVGDGKNYFVNSALDIILEDGAGATCSQIQEDCSDAFHCSKTRIILERDARFETVNASFGSRLARHHYEVTMKDEGGEFRMQGITVLNNSEQAHYYVRVHHEAPRCSSNLHFKNLVNDKARSSVDGTVVVSKDAQLTNSDQLINNLLLSDDAHVDSKPNLIINADDVKCTHGNTVGQIDEEQLFYLKTRGLSEAFAKTLLTTSFAASIIEEVPFDPVRLDLENTLLKKLESCDG